MPIDELEIELCGIPAELGITNLDQYFGAWSIYEPRFSSLMQSLNRFDLSAHVAARQGSQISQGEGIHVSDGIAMLGISGVMTKRGSSLSGSGGTIALRRQIRNAMQDDSVKAIHLTIESPGGTSAGTKELADDVRAAKAIKPVAAFFEDIGASAAYYFGSQADTVSANEPAIIGSIGTMVVVHDSSEAAEKAGWKVHVVSTGKLKGSGVPGSKLTDEQLAEYQKLVDTQNTIFLQAVADGRGMKLAQVKQLADGGVHVAGDALELGLIDRVETLDESIDRLRSRLSTKEVFVMSDTTTTDNTPKAATLAEIKAACPGADSDFVLAQLEVGATVQAAQTAFIAKQSSDLAAAKQAATEAAEKAAKAQASTMPGNEPITSNADTSTDEEKFGGNASLMWKMENEKLITMGISPTEAANQVESKFPGLREAYLAEFGGGNPKKDLFGG